MAISQLQQQAKQGNINTQQQQLSPLASPSHKKVLIFSGDSPSLRLNNQQKQQDQETNSFKTYSQSPHSPSILNGKTAGRSILKPIKVSMEPNSQIQQQFNWDDKNNNQNSFSTIDNQQLSQKMQVNQSLQLHQRAHSDISRTIDQKAQMLSPKIQFSSSQPTEKKQNGFKLQLQDTFQVAKQQLQPKIELNSISTTQNTMLSSNNSRSRDSSDNSQLLIFSPMRQKIMGNKGLNQSLDGPMISVNDRIPFKINNGSSKEQFGNNLIETQNNLNYAKSTSSFDNNNITINSEDNGSPYHRQDQFIHTSSYLKRRLQQLDQNKFKPIYQLPLVSEETTETTRNQTPYGNTFNSNSNNNSSNNGNSQRSNLSIFRDTQDYEESPFIPQFQGKQNQQYYSLRSPENKASLLPTEGSKFPDLKQKSYQVFSSVSPASRQTKSNGMSQQRNSYDQDNRKVTSYRRQNSQQDSSRHHKSQDIEYYNNDNISDIVPFDAEMNRRKHRLLERLQAKNSPNKFHYDEHFLDQREDEMHQLNSPPGQTHPLRNIYDHRNPMRVYQLRNSIPLANQKIILDPETYTNQLFCHANMKRQRNQERVIHLLEEQDHMMGRLIGKYKKRAEEEEEILAKKLDQLEKEKDSLVHLKYQEQKLGQLQQNLTTKLSQLKENAGFYNGKIQPTMNNLRPDMYDQCTDMYDLAFLDSILRQDQIRYGRIKQRYGIPGNTKYRSQSVMD